MMMGMRMMMEDGGWPKFVATRQFVCPAVVVFVPLMRVRKVLRCRVCQWHKCEICLQMLSTVEINFPPPFSCWFFTFACNG